jgi:hypothetical protein
MIKIIYHIKDSSLHLLPEGTSVFSNSLCTKGRENPIFINFQKTKFYHAVLMHNHMPIGNKQET